METSIGAAHKGLCPDEKVDFWLKRAIHLRKIRSGLFSTDLRSGSIS
jgi:hypothetical protein